MHVHMQLRCCIVMRHCLCVYNLCLRVCRLTDSLSEAIQFSSRCMAFSCSRLSCMMHATSHKVHLRQAACASSSTGVRCTKEPTASLPQYAASFAPQRRHCRVVQQERSMAVGCAAAASGSQQTVSEKYERLDGVKVPTVCNVVLCSLTTCLALHQKLSGWHTAAFGMYAGVVGLRPEAGSDHRSVGPR